VANIRTNEVTADRDRRDMILAPKEGDVLQVIELVEVEMCDEASPLDKVLRASSDGIG
jgi:hypothetical protein